MKRRKSGFVRTPSRLIFFENSDDEDSESSVLIFDPDQDQDQDSGSEGDEVPEEWVDDDDDDSME